MKFIGFKISHFVHDALVNALAIGVRITGKNS